MTSEYQKMIAGEVYRPSDPELRALVQASRQKQSAFNKERRSLEGSRNHQGLVLVQPDKILYVNPRLVVDYGVNIHLGEIFILIGT